MFMRVAEMLCPLIRHQSGFARTGIISVSHFYIRGKGPATEMETSRRIPGTCENSTDRKRRLSCTIVWGPCSAPRRWPTTSPAQTWPHEPGIEAHETTWAKSLRDLVPFQG